MRHPMTDLEREELIAPLERALIIFSHPDDAEFSAAPTIAALTASGARVDYVVTTDGGKGTDDPAVTPEQLAATRIAEQRAAADVLGVGEIVHLGYPDGYLQPTLELRRDIVRQIRRFRPDLVIAQNPQRRADGNPFIAHPDHLATGEATLAAVYPAARDRLNFPELIGRRARAVEGAPGTGERRRAAEPVGRRLGHPRARPPGAASPREPDRRLGRGRGPRP